MIIGIVVPVVDHRNSPNWTVVIVQSQEESCLGMFVEWVAFWVEHQVGIHLQWRHPLRRATIDLERQIQELTDLFSICEIYLENLHDLVPKILLDQVIKRLLRLLCPQFHLFAKDQHILWGKI